MIRVRQKRFIKIDSSLGRRISSSFITRSRAIIMEGFSNNNNRIIIKRMTIMKIMITIMMT